MTNNAQNAADDNKQPPLKDEAEGFRWMSPRFAVSISVAVAALFLLSFHLPLSFGKPSSAQAAWPADFDEALKAPGKVTLYSLDPIRMNGLEESQHKGEALYKYKVLGKTVLTEDQAKEAIAEFKVAVTLWDGDWAKCFNPRHALRIERDGGQTYELLLCYECSRMLAWKDGKYVFHYGVGGKPDKLNEILKATGLPLAKPPGES